MSESPRGERSPGTKLLFVALIGLALTIPLLLVYALVYDRQDQSQTAQAAINAGWGGPQVVSGPVVVVPFKTTQNETVEVNGKDVTRAVEYERLLYISPTENVAKTAIEPDPKQKSIYKSILYTAKIGGTVRFALPEDLSRFGVTREQLQWNRAELRVGASDSRGLTTGGMLNANGKELALQPGKGPAASGGAGFFAFLPWDGTGELAVDYAFGLRGSRSLSLVPRGGSTKWEVRSTWPSPGFGGSFLPDKPDITDEGFLANYTIDKLALGEALVSLEDPGVPVIDDNPQAYENAISREAAMSAAASDGNMAAEGPNEVVGGRTHVVTVGLVEPVNLYSQVDRAVKYGFLFIGFTFLTFFLFDVIGGARVAAAEYLLTGAALILFFVLLLAFAEVIGFTPAYLVAGGSIVGLLASYSAAVLKSWRRGKFIGALLTGLYALLFVLLNLEAWSLLIGSVLLFVALAGVMYATRNVDWSAMGRREVEA